MVAYRLLPSQYYGHYIEENFCENKSEMKNHFPRVSVSEARAKTFRVDVGCEVFRL